MRDYADSSLLISSVLKDSHSQAARDFLDQSGRPLVFTAFHKLEVTNAFHQLVFRKIVDQDQIRQATRILNADLHSGRLVRARVRWPAALQTATELSTLHSASVGARSLDVLHVACATELRIERFASFDARQRELARRAGLTVVP